MVFVFNCRTNMGDIDCQMMVEERTGEFAFGAPCSNGLDCLSRLCLGQRYRYVCSAFCNPTRPNDCHSELSCIPDTGEIMFVDGSMETVMMSNKENHQIYDYSVQIVATCSMYHSCLYSA